MVVENYIPSHTHSQLTDHLIMPLLSMVGELSRRQSELIKLLGRKDREIQDYKDHGATVSRSREPTVHVCMHYPNYTQPVRPWIHNSVLF